MKKILPAAILIFGLSTAQVSTYPWTETFEDASPTLSLWTQVQESGTKSWTTESSYYPYTPNTPYSGTKMAQFNCASFSDDTTKYISPFLDLASTTNPTIVFQYRNKMWDTDQNILKLYYRTSSTASWVLLQTYNTDITNWTSSGVINLPNPTATYQIALEGIAKYGYNLNVDEVVVSSGILATDEITKKENLRIYPNPATEVLNIKASQDITEAMVYDTMGKIVINKKEINNQIKISHLLPGVYFLQTKDKTGKINREKFIKK